MPVKNPLKILMADDDEDDWFLVKAVPDELGGMKSFHVVENREELLKYMHCKKPYQDRQKYPLADIILLDLNMPRMDGWEAPRNCIKGKKFKGIPVIIFTTSQDKETAMKSYRESASSVIVKPFTHAGLKERFETLIKYWGNVVELPEEKNPDCME